MSVWLHERLMHSMGGALRSEKGASFTPAERCRAGLVFRMDKFEGEFAGGKGTRPGSTHPRDGGVHAIDPATVERRANTEQELPLSEWFRDESTQSLA